VPDPDVPTVVSKAVDQVAQTVVRGVKTVVKPTVAASVATTFSFPLALMAFVLLFLLAQSAVDRRDPKLRAKANANESILGFEDEESL
jgi:hypothetical protein